MSKQKVIEPLSADELTVLEIAVHGEFMIETGRWHDPIMSLVKKGYMEGPQFNRYITDAGRAAIGSRLADKEKAEDDMYRELETRLRKQAIAQKVITEKLAGVVDIFVEVAKISSEATGKSAVDDLYQWISSVRRDAENRLKAK